LKAHSEYFDEHFDAERLGKGAQVLDRSHGGLELFLVERVVEIADVLNEKRNGICSAISSARLISSMASMRPARSVEAISTGGEPVRPTRNRSTKARGRNSKERRWP